MGLTLPASYLRPRAILRGEDVLDIAQRVQDGDPTVGWRGDPGMDLYQRGHEVRVYAFDARGERYCAASVDASNPDWRHELLRKLRDGDWQRGSAIDDMLAAEAARQAAADKARDEQTEEVAARFAAAALRDNGIRHSHYISKGN